MTNLHNKQNKAFTQFFLIEHHGGQERGKTAQLGYADLAEAKYGNISDGLCGVTPVRSAGIVFF